MPVSPIRWYSSTVERRWEEVATPPGTQALAPKVPWNRPESLIDSLNRVHLFATRWVEFPPANIPGDKSCAMS